MTTVTDTNNTICQCPSDVAARGNRVLSYATPASNNSGGFIYRLFNSAAEFGIPGCVGQLGRPLYDVKNVAGTILAAESPVTSNRIARNNSYVIGPSPVNNPDTTTAPPPGNDPWQNQTFKCGTADCLAQTGFVKPSHNGGWNYIFADGHTKWHKPEQTVDGNAGDAFTGTMPLPLGFWTIREDD